MAVYDAPFWRATGSGLATARRIREARVRQHPGGGLPGVLLGFIEGEEGRELGRRRGRTPRRGHRLVRTVLRNRRRPTDRLLDQYGQRSRRRAAATWVTCRRASGHAGARAPEPWDESTGPAPRQPTTGPATWTARSVRRTRREGSDRRRRSARNAGAGTRLTGSGSASSHRGHNRRSTRLGNAACCTGRRRSPGWDDARARGPVLDGSMPTRGLDLVSSVHRADAASTPSAPVAEERRS